MATYTRAQVLQVILDNIAANGANAITGDVLQGVLNIMADQEGLADNVIFENDFLGSNTVEDALLALAGSNIPAWNTDAEYPAGYVVKFNHVLYEALTIIEAGGVSPSHNASWGAISGGSGTTPMTADEIRDSLQTLTGEDMLDSAKTKYTGYDSSAAAFAALFAKFITTYNPATTYQIGHVVSYGSYLRMCKVAGTLNVLPTNADNWVIIGREEDTESSTNFMMYHDGDEKVSSFAIPTGETISFDERGLYKDLAFKFLWEITGDSEATPTTFNTRSFDHQFDDEDVYTIKLTVYNSLGNEIATETKTNFITVQEPVVDFRVYWGLSADDAVDEAEILGSTNFIDETPAEIEIPFAMAEAAFPWFAAPATMVYTEYMAHVLPIWNDIANTYNITDVYVDGILHKLYIYKHMTEITTISFKI